MPFYRNRRRALLLALLLSGAVGAAGAVRRVETVSVSTGQTPGDAPSSNPSLDAGGRLVAFESEATNLVPGDTNGVADIFVRDRTTGGTERVSVTSDGTQADDAGDELALGFALTGSSFPKISADGRYVAFQSAASNLDLGDTNGVIDLFVRDRVTGLTERVSVSSSGSEANRRSSGAAISADGRYVAFDSEADNLVPDDTNGKSDIFVRDRLLRTTERVSLLFYQSEANGHSFQPAISADGRYVAFVSEATNLVAADRNNVADIFVRDRRLATTERVSRSTSGEAGNEAGRSPAISADGRYVAFVSYATNLVPGLPESFESHIYVRNRVASTTEQIDVSSAGISSDSFSERPSISADGRYVVFESYAQNLVSQDTNLTADVFVRDRAKRSTVRVSLAADGSEWDNQTGSPAISPDGRYVGFVSYTCCPTPTGEPDRDEVRVVDLGEAVTPTQVAVFRLGTGEWFLRRWDGVASIQPWGKAGDVPVPADYLGTGFAQIAVFRPGSGEWVIRADGDVPVGPETFGAAGDLPVPADYLGVRRAQIATYRPSTREWRIRNDAGATVGPTVFGARDDRPAPADYLGLGRAQIAVFRPATRTPLRLTAQWLIRSDTGATIGPIALGGADAVPVAADYLGLGRAQIAVYEPRSSEWLIRRESGAVIRIPFGRVGDVPVPGDYNGSGRTQIAVYRPGTGEWLIRDKEGRVTTLPWGGPGDRPVPAPFADRFAWPLLLP